MGLEYNSTCPFCGKDTINEQNMLTPWGFAPVNGQSTKEADADAELTYASAPCYSITPADNEMKHPSCFSNLRYCKRSDDPLIILNKGNLNAGFMVCKDCGAAMPGDDADVLKKVFKPFRHPYSKRPCFHPSDRLVNTYLGNQFLTDLVVYEITLDTDCINAYASGLWVTRAAQTLAEAMTLAGGRLLDIEFNEIKSGYRLRYAEDTHSAFVDIFLFDSLSSGAGYCSEIADRTEELIFETRRILQSCPNQCDSACHDCLMHYWNQRVHSLLDRYAALELLEWSQTAKIPEPLSYDVQNDLLSPLNALSAEFSIFGDGKKHYIKTQNKEIELLAYPAMWSETSSLLPKNAISISDRKLKYALPYVDEIIRKCL